MLLLTVQFLSLYILLTTIILPKYFLDFLDVKTFTGKAQMFISLSLSKIGEMIRKELCGNVIFLVGNTYSYALVLLVTALEPTYLTTGTIIPLYELY